MTDAPTDAHPDLSHAADQTAAVALAITDDQLGAPTPCSAYAVRDVVVHLIGLSHAFTAAAAKNLGPLTDTPPGDVTDEPLDPDWRDQVSVGLDRLALAWRSPDAWQSMTRAGGVDLPGEIAGIVALDEVVLHGWDLAVATGYEGYDPGQPALSVLHGFLSQSRAGDQFDAIFAPVIPVPGDAPLLDRVLGLAGRDPHWRAATD